MVDVAGVGATDEAVPPDATVYQLSEAPLTGDADRAVLVCPWQYVRLVTPGVPGVFVTVSPTLFALVRTGELDETRT